MKKKCIYFQMNFKKQLLKFFHDNSQIEHFDYDKILKLMKRKYYWSKITANIKNYVISCSNCVKIKIFKQKSYKLLQSLSISKKTKQNWIMNFIINLFSNKFNDSVYDFILIIVDRYIKYARYISLRKSWNAEKLTDVMFNKIFTKFDLFKFIISDRGSLFTAQYWFDFCYYLQIKLKYNIVFHFQTEKQTKKQNQILKQYLRCYINYQQNNWITWLSLTKFAYNNSCHNVVKIFLLQVIFDENPQWKNQIIEKKQKIVSAIKKKQNKHCICKIY